MKKIPEGSIPAVNDDGTCSWSCPFHDSYTESGWGVVRWCRKGAVKPEGEQYRSHIGYDMVCPHHPFAAAYRKFSKMPVEERRLYIAEIEKLTEVVNAEQVEET